MHTASDIRHRVTDVLKIAHGLLLMPRLFQTRHAQHNTRGPRFSRADLACGENLHFSALHVSSVVM